MSSGNYDSFNWLLDEKDAIDGRDEFDFLDDETVAIPIKDVWGDFFEPKKCDCGAVKVKTTHALWCSTKENK